MVRSPIPYCRRILPSTLIWRPTLAALIVSADQTRSFSKLGRADDAFGNDPCDFNVRPQQTVYGEGGGGWASAESF